MYSDTHAFGGEDTATEMACSRCDHRLLHAAPDAEAGPGEGVCGGSGTH